MSRAADLGPLPFNYRDVGLALPSTCSARLPGGRLLRCGAIENFSWAALGRPRTIINLRQGADAVSFDGCTMLQIGAANDLEKYDTSNKAVREWVCAVLNAITAAEHPILIHCRSGRDRTGVIVAALLGVIGVPESDIVNEYALSDGAISSLLEQTLGPWRAAGGIGAWLRGVDLKRLRARLVAHERDDTELCHSTPAAIVEERDYLCARVHDLWPLARPQSGVIDQSSQAQLCAAMLPVFERLSELRPVRNAGRIYAAHGWCLEALGQPTRADEAFAEAEACGHLDCEENTKLKRFVAHRRRVLASEGASSTPPHWNRTPNGAPGSSVSSASGSEAAAVSSSVGAASSSKGSCVEDLPVVLGGTSESSPTDAQARPPPWTTPPTLFVVSERAHERMLAWPGGGAANMEVPSRLVAARNALFMLPTPLRAALQPVVDVPLSRDDLDGSWRTLETDLLRAHTAEFVHGMRRRFLEDDPEATASFAAVTSVLAIADAVRRPSQSIAADAQSPRARDGGVLPSGLALVRPAGHHSSPDQPAPLCAINSVMVAALREAHTTGQPVGVLDIDVHFATGSQKIAMRWNEKLKGPTDGHVIVADVYAAMGPPARLVERVQAEYADLQARAFSGAALKAEMDAEFASARPHEREVVDMVCNSHLSLPHSREELDDAAVLAASTRALEHLVGQGVGAIFVSLGLDAAEGDREGAQVSPGGFKSVAALLRRQGGVRLVFALEGGYDVGELDAGAVLSGAEEAGPLDLEADRFMGTGNFGRCIHAVASALVT